MAPQIWNVPGIPGAKMLTTDGAWFRFMDERCSIGVSADTPNRAVELFHQRFGTICPEDARPIRV